jgi:hypothetical protein
MKKKDALELRRGDRVWFGDTRCMKDHRFRYSGLVERVTENGGVLVELLWDNEDPRPWWCRPVSDWDRPEKWTGHHHIYRHEPWTGRRLSE